MTAVKPVLTAGQVAVLQLYADGNSYREVGDLLGISESAAKSRCARAAEALGTKHVTNTYAEAKRRGLLEEERTMSDTSRPQLFRLQRDEDVTGASGTGHVADGVQWPDGTVTVKWRGDFASEVSWPKGMEAVERIHGHDGRTRVIWDGEPEHG